MSRTRMIAVASALAVAAWFPSPLAAQSVRENMWGTNGTVNAMALSNNVMYLGGTFTRVGPPTGSYAGVDLASGTTLQPYLQVVGTVFAQVADGNGGWYIGGSFSSVRGIPRKSLAQVDRNGNVTSWDPNASNPDVTFSVLALARSGQTVYVGGIFDSLGAGTRRGLGSVDATTGALSTWAPSLFGQVSAFYISGSTLFAGGAFMSLSGEARNNLAAFDLTTGALTSWNPGASGQVKCLGPSPDANYLIAGGEFDRVAGTPRTRLAMIHKTTGALAAWDPAPNNTVLTVASDPSAIYVGGKFTQIAAVARDRIAAIHPVNGSALPFSPGATGQVNVIVAKNDGFPGSPSTIFVGGEFDNIGGVARGALATLNESGTVLSWAPHCTGAVNTIAITASSVFVGGNMDLVGSVPRANLAAINVTTGFPTDWSPAVTRGLPILGPAVQALAVYQSAVFVGGNYLAINGTPQNCFVALDALTGDPLPWNLNTNSVVSALALHGSHLYIGGQFTVIGSGVTRPFAAAIDAISGAVLSWNPNFNDSVHALSIRSSINAGQSVIFAGGQFTQVNGVTRTSIAAISEAGTVTSWTPPPTDAFAVVYAIRFMPIGQFGGGTVWVGGNFYIGSQRYAAALDASTGAQKPWYPVLNGPVRCLQVYNGGLLVGGQWNTGVTILDMSTAAPTAWDAKANNLVFAVFATGNNVYLGGSFTQILNTSHRCFGALSGSSVPTGVDGEPTTDAPRRTVLLASPNPFGQETTVRFNLSSPERATVLVYDVSGRLVRTLRRSELGVGEQAVHWDGSDDGGKAVGSGIYFVRVDAPSFHSSTKTFRLR